MTNNGDIPLSHPGLQRALDKAIIHSGHRE